MFIRNEDFRSFLRHYPIVSLIVAVNIVIFFIVHFHLTGGFLYYEMLDVNARVALGEYWRLVTPIFLHYGFFHVLFNCFSIVLFAPALERILGKIMFPAAYVLAGVLGNLATYFLEPLNYASLGASGAIFGLFGIYVYMVLFRKDLIDRANSQLVMTILIFALVSTFLTSGINIVAHLFGFIGGMLLAPPLLSRVPLNYSWYPSDVSSRRGHYQDTTVTFDPNRWKKRLKRQNTAKKIVWGLVTLFILFGLVSYLIR
ncbi:MAG TPA: rhomboid family intramembrane serine protease [Bacillales bacterium]|nr:rhomboid family intramembrane serine protease [Bacillales bacterium]